MLNGKTKGEKIMEKVKYNIFKIECGRNNEYSERRYIGYTFATSAKQALNNMRFRMKDWSISSKMQYEDDYITYCVAEIA